MATDARESDGPRQQAPRPPKVRAIACLGGVCLERGVPIEDIRQYLRDTETVVWLDVQDPSPDELSMLLEEFGFHPLAMEDVAKTQQRAKVDEYKGYLFAVTFGIGPGEGVPVEVVDGVAGAERSEAPATQPAHDGDELRTVEVDLFIGRNYLVSVHRGTVPALDEATARWTRGGQMLREGVGFLAYTVMDSLIDAYFPLLENLEQQMSELEVELFTRLQQGAMQRVLRHKRTLIALRKVLHPLREVFHVFLRPNHPFFSADTRVYFHNVYDHVLRILDALDIEREMVAGVTEAYLTISSNRLNVTMKKLTVATICVAILGAVFRTGA